MVQDSQKIPKDMISPLPPPLGIGLFYSGYFKAEMGISRMDEFHQTGILVHESRPVKWRVFDYWVVRPFGWVAEPDMGRTHQKGPNVHYFIHRRIAGGNILIDLRLKATRA
jgi:hypothetical protein